MVENIFYNSIMEHLHYADGTGTPLYSGNISSMTWAYGIDPDKGVQVLIRRHEPARKCRIRGERLLHSPSPAGGGVEITYRH